MSDATLRMYVAPPDSWFAPDDRPDSAAGRVGRLPVGPDVSRCLNATVATAHAIVAVRPGSNEIRIPYIRRTDKGDFARLIDALVDAIGIDRVRFTNIFEDDEESQAAYDAVESLYDALDVDPFRPDDAVRIEDAVHGFDKEYETWGDDRVATLVGTWKTDD